MKAAITSMDMEVMATAHPLRWRYRTDDTDQWSLAHNAETAPPADNRAEDIPNHMKVSHTISVDIIVSASWAAYEKQQRTHKQDYYSDQGSITPWLPYDLQNTVISFLHIISGQIQALT